MSCSQAQPVAGEAAVTRRKGFAVLFGRPTSCGGPAMRGAPPCRESCRSGDTAFTPVPRKKMYGEENTAPGTGFDESKIDR